MTEGAGVEDVAKDNLLEQFRRYLDGIEEMPPAPTAGSEADLFTLSVEMAALRNEVRTESRPGEQEGER
jgi:hypothetical protein